MNKKKYFFSGMFGCTSSWLVWVVLCASAIVDRLLKLWAIGSCKESFSLTPWLQCDLVVNRGVSFGLFHANNPWIFGAVTFFVMVLTGLVGFHAVIQARRGHSYVGELCIIVGSLSNLLDRFIYDGVIDFIVVSTPWGYWPAYNIADALIICGVALLIITNYRES
jgi:signal peptidase II